MAIHLLQVHHKVKMVVDRDLIILMVLAVVVVLVVLEQMV
jgi:hypothetical protein